MLQRTFELRSFPRVAALALFGLCVGCSGTIEDPNEPLPSSVASNDSSCDLSSDVCRSCVPGTKCRPAPAHTQGDAPADETTGKPASACNCVAAASLVVSPMVTAVTVSQTGADSLR